MNIGAHGTARKIRTTEKRNVLVYRISQEHVLHRQNLHNGSHCIIFYKTLILLMLSRN